MQLRAQVAIELYLVSFDCTDGLKARMAARRLEVKRLKRSQDIGRPARNIRDEQRLARIVPTQDANGREELRKRDAKEGWITEDQAKLFSEPVRFIQVVRPETSQGTEPIIHIQRANFNSSPFQLLPDRWGAKAAGIIEPAGKVGQVSHR